MYLGGSWAPDRASVAIKNVGLAQKLREKKKRKKTTKECSKFNWLNCADCCGQQGRAGRQRQKSLQHLVFPSKFPSKYLSDRQPSNGWAELSRAEQQSANGWAMLSKAHAQQTNHWARIGIRHLAVWAVIQKYWWPLMNDWTVFFTLRYVWYNYVLSNEWNSIYLWIICLIFKVLHDNISC